MIVKSRHIANDSNVDELLSILTRTLDELTALGAEAHAMELMATKLAFDECGAVTTAGPGINARTVVKGGTPGQNEATRSGVPDFSFTSTGRPDVANSVRNLLVNLSDESKRRTGEHLSADHMIVSLLQIIGFLIVEGAAEGDVGKSLRATTQLLAEVVQNGCNGNLCGKVH